MRTNFPETLLATDAGQRANEILRSCVHCGFCNATCPTYQLTGDELDGPRGRIYLIRDLLEEEADAKRTTMHLDRCLTCRACETTCPSGVAYGELAEIARNTIGTKRKGLNGLLRTFVQWLVPDASRLRLMSRLGALVRPMIPHRLRKHVPKKIGQGTKPNDVHGRKVLLLDGCAQQVSSGSTNSHLVTLLDAAGIGVLLTPYEGCCGALDLHLGDESKAVERVKANIDAIYPYLEDCEAIISTASGCGVTVKDYGRLLTGDPVYAEKAIAVAEATQDVVEYVERLQEVFVKRADIDRIAWHPPCSLQHGMQITGAVESLLTNVGYELVPVKDQHLCCGSAGTYSILQPRMSNALGDRKMDALLAHHPDVIATANVGCESHLAHRTGTPVLHWIELLTSKEAG